MVQYASPGLSPSSTGGQGGQLSSGKGYTPAHHTHTTISSTSSTIGKVDILILLTNSVYLPWRMNLLPMFMQALSTAAPQFQYQELFDLGHDDKTPYKKLTGDYVSTIKVFGSRNEISYIVSLYDHKQKQITRISI